MTREDVANLLALCIDPNDDDALLVPRLGPPPHVTLDHARLARGASGPGAPGAAAGPARRGSAAGAGAGAGGAAEEREAVLFDLEGLDDVSAPGGYGRTHGD